MAYISVHFAQQVMYHFFHISFWGLHWHIWVAASLGLPTGSPGDSLAQLQLHNAVRFKGACSRITEMHHVSSHELRQHLQVLCLLFAPPDGAKCCGLSASSSAPRHAGGGAPAGAAH